MRSYFFALAALAASVAPAALAAPGARATAGLVHVRLVTSDGPIILALDMRHAPHATTNFMAYVDDGRFDGTTFYRSARKKSAPAFGYVQGGIGVDARRILPPFAHEPTTQTGIRHLDMTISMARRADPNSAGGNFFITVGAIPTMDASATSPGYAAFGHVVAGQATIKRILAEPTGGGYDAMKDQMILRPVKIFKAERLDGLARPTGREKPWLLMTRR